MISLDIKRLCKLTEDFCPLDITAQKNLQTYADLLVEWNEKMNLTAITDSEGILIKHFYDCLLFFKDVEIEDGASVIDVGTGAGFPGVVLKIARPDIKLTLLDSLNKRLIFLNEVLSAVNLSADIVHARAEEGAHDIKLREKFDFATARAVASLPVLSEYCLPYVKPGGKFVALKGPAAEEEISAGKRAIKLLSGELSGVYENILPSGETRNTVVVKKLAACSEKYPRPTAKIKKASL